MTTPNTDLAERIETSVREVMRRSALIADVDLPAYLTAAVLSIVEAEVRKAKAEALRDASRYFAGGLHCADMRTTPEETVRELNRRATEYETGDPDERR